MSRAHSSALRAFPDPLPYQAQRHEQDNTSCPLRKSPPRFPAGSRMWSIPFHWELERSAPQSRWYSGRLPAPQSSGRGSRLPGCSWGSEMRPPAEGPGLLPTPHPAAGTELGGGPQLRAAQPRRSWILCTGAPSRWVRLQVRGLSRGWGLCPVPGGDRGLQSRAQHQSLPLPLPYVFAQASGGPWAPPVIACPPLPLEVGGEAPRGLLGGRGGTGRGWAWWRLGVGSEGPGTSRASPLPLR